jgi:hypothetical protein
MPAAALAGRIVSGKLCPGALPSLPWHRRSLSRSVLSVLFAPPEASLAKYPLSIREKAGSRPDGWSGLCPIPQKHSFSPDLAA